MLNSGSNSDGGDGGANPFAEDGDLIVRIAKDRDRAAFRALFDRFAGRIKGFLMKSGASPEEADEVAQEAMLSIWRKAASFDPARAPASAWIFAIARNQRIDQLRRARRPEPDPEDPLFHPDPEPPAEAELLIAERDAALREAVAALTEAQREAVRLAFFVGMSHPQIAASTGAPLGTVKSRLRLATARLREALGDEFGEDFLDE